MVSSLISFTSKMIGKIGKMESVPTHTCQFLLEGGVFSLEVEQFSIYRAGGGVKGGFYC